MSILKKWRSELEKAKSVGVRGAGVCYLTEHGKKRIAERYFNSSKTTNQRNLK